MRVCNPSRCGDGGLRQRVIMLEDEGRLISGHEVEFEAPGCTPGANWWKVTVSLKDDISEVLPYLNAEADRADYRHSSKVLIWDRGETRIALRSHEIAIAPVADREVGARLCDEVIRTLEDVWSRRHEIDPKLSGRVSPGNVLDIWKLLPGTNCRECGCATCMAYAAALVNGQAELSQCSGLRQVELRENHEKLAGLLTGEVR